MVLSIETNFPGSVNQAGCIMSSAGTQHATIQWEGTSHQGVQRVDVIGDVSLPHECAVAQRVCQKARVAGLLCGS